LTPDEKEKLEVLFSHSPELKEAYGLALKLTQIYNTHMSKEEAIVKINEWIKEVKNSRVDCFTKFIKTLEKNKNEISNYFINRHTSGFVEGLNNNIKVLKRRCYGIFNIKNLFQRLHLDISGCSVRNLNSHFKSALYHNLPFLPSHVKLSA
jgi:transposase